MVSRSRFCAASTRLLLMLMTSAALLGSGEASGAQLTASWVDNSNGVAITRVERRLGTDTVFTAIADVSPGVTGYVDSSVSPGTMYCYQALAYDADGVSPFSDEACATSGSDVHNLQVTVSKTGNGAGTVASTPAGINCGTACAGTYAAGTAVTLAATPAHGSAFKGWSGGGCVGTAPCIFAGNAPVTATASFTIDAAPRSTEIILDNASAGVQDAAGGRTFTGSWCTSAASNQFGATALHNCLGAVAATYRWTPTIPTAGAWDVYVWWGAQPFQSTSAQVTVVSADGSFPGTFNQQTGGGQWVLHGRYTFSAGTAGYVEAANNGERPRLGGCGEVRARPVRAEPSANWRRRAQDFGRAGSWPPSRLITTEVLRSVRRGPCAPRSIGGRDTPADLVSRPSPRPRDGRRRAQCFGRDRPHLPA